jgi:hypothetical protein
MSEHEIEDFLQKVESGLAEAQHNMLVEKALHNQSLVVTDGKGGVVEIPAKDLLAK